MVEFVVQFYAGARSAGGSRYPIWKKVQFFYFKWTVSFCRVARGTVNILRRSEDRREKVRIFYHFRGIAQKGEKTFAFARKVGYIFNITFCAGA
ncbi:hypothetical protein [uncultured Anaerotruncus sp.]|uniref:hypothetical protein n=1 Tax=uncultured Anaerotruncus sp. TaxID=905011 RepID=UPI002671BF7C|nr:hypothetical protein [uncultured Anaerotruncus sp.]